MSAIPSNSNFSSQTVIIYVQLAVYQSHLPQNASISGQVSTDKGKLLHFRIPTSPIVQSAAQSVASAITMRLFPVPILLGG